MGISYIPVAKLGEVAAGDMKEVDLGGRPILLANVSGKYFAFSRHCPHEDADLKTGLSTGSKSAATITTTASISRPANASFRAAARRSPSCRRKSAVKRFAYAWSGRRRDLLPPDHFG